MCKEDKNVWDNFPIRRDDADEELFRKQYLQVPYVDERVYVLVGDHKEARDFIKRLEVDKGLLRNVTSQRDLAGIDGRGKTLHVYGTAYRHPDYYGIMDAADVRGFAVKGYKE